MAETFNKKEREKKKRQIQQEKQQRKLERKQQTRDGNNLDEMMAYLDINGNLTHLPPDKQETISTRRDHASTDNQGGSFRTGTIKFVNYKKGFGFIRDNITQESVFVHVNVLPGQVQENSQVKFKTRNDSRGITAIFVELVA